MGEGSLARGGLETAGEETHGPEGEGGVRPLGPVRTLRRCGARCLTSFGRCARACLFSASSTGALSFLAFSVAA